MSKGIALRHATYHSEASFAEFLHQTKAMSRQLQKGRSTSFSRRTFWNLDWRKLAGCEMLLPPFSLKQIKLANERI
jgi:hypothetical protein